MEFGSAEQRCLLRCLISDQRSRGKLDSAAERYWFSSRLIARSTRQAAFCDSPVLLQPLVHTGDDGAELRVSLRSRAGAWARIGGNRGHEVAAPSVSSLKLAVCCSLALSLRVSLPISVTGTPQAWRL